MIRTIISVFCYLAGLVGIAIMIVPFALQAAGGLYFHCDGVSMEPTIHRGDVLLVRPMVSDPYIGQIVVARFEDDGKNDQLYIHRVKEKENDGRVLLKGDNNPEPDPQTINDSQIVGYPTIHLTGFWANSFAASQTMMGRILIAAATVATLLIPTFFPTGSKRRQESETVPHDLVK